jgi:hypothetical protein
MMERDEELRYIQPGLAQGLAAHLLAFRAGAIRAHALLKLVQSVPGSDAAREIGEVSGIIPSTFFDDHRVLHTSWLLLLY